MEEYPGERNAKWTSAQNDNNVQQGDALHCATSLEKRLRGKHNTEGSLNGGIRDFLLYTFQSFQNLQPMSHLFPVAEK